MPQDDGRDLIVVSDFHLSAGGGDDQRLDEQFARFIDHLCERAGRERQPWRLLILGDLCDFLRVRLPYPQPPTAEGVACAKLNLIAAEHPRFLAALGRCVAAGFPIDIVPGNHDVELMHPSVQRRLRDLVAAAGGGAQAATDVRFRPWIYYIPGMLYAEHGHQYHDLNSFPALLDLSTGRGLAEMEAPLGTHFEHYLSGLRGAAGPAPEVRRPALRPLVRAAQPRAWGYHARFARALLARLARPAGGRDAQRAAYRARALPAYAEEAGLSVATLAALDRLSADVAAGLPRRLLRRALAALPLPRVPGAAPHYMLAAALAIHRLLSERRADVPCYVFGHTHEAASVPLGAGADSPRYLNPGSWSAPARGQAAGPHLCFVQITRAPGAARPLADLLRWDDGRAVCAPCL